MMTLSDSALRLGVALLIVSAEAAALRGQTACTVPPDAIAAINRADSDWLPAMRSHDVARIVAPYDSSGIFVTADGKSIEGRDRIAEMYRTRFLRIARVVDGAIMRDGACAEGDSLVNEWGRGRLTYTDPAGTTHQSVGPYLTVWMRKTAGEWRIIRNLVF